MHSVVDAEARCISSCGERCFAHFSGGALMLRVLLVTAVVGLSAAEWSAADPAGQLTDKTFAEWRDRIRPKNDEQCFKTVNWLPTFWDGVMAAQKADKPILLWAMNGHPLACT
jgi:hypothetical protein